MPTSSKDDDVSYAGLIGGARPNAGRPPGYVKSDDLKALDAAKARLESIKADRQELAHKIELGKYVNREAIKQVAATTIAMFSQTMRSMPDAIERRLGVEPKVAETIGEMIDAALNELADGLNLMAGRESEE
jgi:phage terminase Nu1 subunit (DNA packaging protein)